MNDLHITLISPNRQHIDQILHGIDDSVPGSQIAVIQAPFESMSTPPDNKGMLEVLLIDCGANAQSDLAAIERLGKIFHSMVFILFSENQSPEFLLQAMRAGVREVLSFPVDPDAVQDTLNRIRSKNILKPARNGKVFAFISCKGASGATFLACNLAYELATNQNAKVALFDLNLQFGDALLFLTSQPPTSTIADVARDIHRLDQRLLLSSMVSISPNLSVLAAPEDPSQAQEVTADDIDAMIKLARTQFDYIIVDVGRSLNALSIKVLDLADLIFPIVQMTLPYIRDGKRLIDTFSHLDYPNSKIRLLINRYSKGGDIEVHHIEQTFGTKVFHIIPNHYESVASSVNQGVPIAKLAPRSPVTKAIEELAEHLVRPEEQTEQGWLSGLMKRIF